MKIQIRSLQKKDINMLKNFFLLNNISDIRRFFDPFPLDDKTAELIIQKTIKDKFLICIFEEEIIAMSMLRGWDEGYIFPSIGIIVDHRYQGHGIGRRITEYSLEMAKKLNCKKVRLSVYDDNIIAINLYKSMGFKEIGKEIVKKNGITRNKIIMIIEGF